MRTKVLAVLIAGSLLATAAIASGSLGVRRPLKVEVGTTIQDNQASALASQLQAALPRASSLDRAP